MPSKGLTARGGEGGVPPDPWTSAAGCRHTLSGGFYLLWALLPTAVVTRYSFYLGAAIPHLTNGTKGKKILN